MKKDPIAESLGPRTENHRVTLLDVTLTGTEAVMFLLQIAREETVKRIAKIHPKQSVRDMALEELNRRSSPQSAIRNPQSAIGKGES